MEQTLYLPKTRQEPGRPLRASGEGVAKVVILGTITIVALLVLAGAGGVLRIAFPALCLGTAVILYAKSKPLYVEFVFWIWFLVPFVRRLADNSAGWQETSPILTTPYLVTGVCVLILVRNMRALWTQRSLPFLLAYAGILYGIVVGLTKYPLLKMAAPILTWLTPVTFAFFLFQCRDQYDEIKAAVQRVALHGTLLMGVYGIYQFFFLPTWDSLWLQNAHTTTFGVAEPMQLRGFSTMNAPVVYALTMAALLLIVLGLKGKLRVLAAGVGIMSLLLSLNRSAWLGFAAGLVYLIWEMPSRQRRHTITAILGCILLLPALLTVPGVNDILIEKFQTFTSLKNDVSYQARNQGYLNAFRQLSLEPFGEGVASPDIDHKTAENDDGIGPHDSMILELLYSLGFVGTLCYLAAFVTLIYPAFRSGYTKNPFDSSMKAIFIAYFTQSLLNDFVMGPPGLLTWSAGALMLSHIYNQRSTATRMQYLSFQKSASRAQSINQPPSYARQLPTQPSGPTDPMWAP